MNKVIAKYKEQIKAQTSSGFIFPDQFNLSQSYTSLLLGILVVIVIAGMLVTFVRHQKPDTINPVKTETISKEIEKIKQNAAHSYTVIEGDTLWGIAEKTYNSGYAWTEIAMENNIANPEMLVAGTTLTMTKSSQILATSTVADTARSLSLGKKATDGAITEKTYTVAEGDTLWDIAIRAYGDGFRWPDIARENNLTNPDLIHPGNVFTIPR